MGKTYKGFYLSFIQIDNKSDSPEGTKPPTLFKTNLTELFYASLCMPRLMIDCCVKRFYRHEIGLHASFANGKILQK